MKKTILIIDDTPDELAELVSPLISTLNIKIAQDGMTGCHLAGLHQPDLILLDVHMPHVNGFNIARLLKNNSTTQHIPIIFITNATDDASRIEGLTLGAVDYICKPFNVRESMLRINIHMKQHLTIALESEEVKPLNENDKDDAIIKSCCAYLETRIANPPSLKALANMFGTNEKKLTALFLDKYDMTVFAWIRQHRLSMSCELLKSNQLSIGQISELLGYSSQAYFTKSFKEAYNCTPTDYMSQAN